MFKYFKSSQIHQLAVMYLLLPDVFENFWNKCFDIYELNPPKKISGLAQQANKGWGHIWKILMSMNE